MVLEDMMQDASAHDGLQAPSHVPEFISVQTTSLTLNNPAQKIPKKPCQSPDSGGVTDD